MIRTYEKLESMLASETDTRTPRTLANLIASTTKDAHPTATGLVLYRNKAGAWYALPIGPDEPITKTAEAVRFKPDGKTAVAFCPL